MAEALADARRHHEERLYNNQPEWTRGMRGMQPEAAAQQELEVPAHGRHQHDERQCSSQPDKRHERGTMRGSGAMRGGGGGVTRGDTKNSWAGQEVSAPGKKRGTRRDNGAIRSGQVEVPLDGRWWHDEKLRRRRTRGNTTNSQGSQEA